MGNVKRQQKFIVSALLLLLGSLVISIYFVVPGYYYYGSPQKIPDNHSFVLSEESPSHVINIYGPQIGISSLQTNDTPVSIVIRYQDQVVFNATDIQEISDYDIEVPVPSSSGWLLEVVRQDADVSIDIATHSWGTPVAYVMGSPLLAFLIAGIVIAFYSLYMMFNTYRGTTSVEMKGAKFLAIIVLLILGTLCWFPLADGAIKGDFTPRNTLVSLPDDAYQYTLNGTHLNASLNLSLLYPGGGVSVSFNMHSMTSSDYPLQMSLITDNTYNLTLEEESNDNDWWITIPFNENSTYVVSFQRIDTDLEVEFNVRTQIGITVSREDIVIPAIFGVLGISAILAGLFIAYRFDKTKTIT